MRGLGGVGAAPRLLGVFTEVRLFSLEVDVEPKADVPPCNLKQQLRRQMALAIPELQE
ncbi:MAG TPA: hypothetical protein VFK36_02810 [Gemmatimonadales bacterium]|nr:hypothetical protein [Gemmatimonadales bacterium]